MVCFFSSRRRRTRLQGDWSSDVCSSDLRIDESIGGRQHQNGLSPGAPDRLLAAPGSITRRHWCSSHPCNTGVCPARRVRRSEEHTSELQSPCNIVCRLLLEQKNICTCSF